MQTNKLIQCVFVEIWKDMQLHNLIIHLCDAIIVASVQMQYS